MKPLNFGRLPSSADVSLSARSADGGAAATSARGQPQEASAGGGITARSLSRISIASCNSIYYDASEDLEDGTTPRSSAFSSLLVMLPNKNSRVLPYYRPGISALQ